MTGDLRLAHPGAVAAARKALTSLLGAALAFLILFAFSSTMATRSKMADLRHFVNGVEARSGNTAGPQADLFYVAETLQLAQTQAQTELQTLATANSVRIESIRTDRIEETAGHIRLGLAVSGVVPEAELGAFLAGLVHHEPVLVVEELNLRRARSTGGSRGERTIAFQLTLSGYSQR